MTAVQVEERVWVSTSEPVTERAHRAAKRFLGSSAQGRTQPGYGAHLRPS
jgi:hypothetical protein